MIDKTGQLFVMSYFIDSPTPHLFNAKYTALVRHLEWSLNTAEWAAIRFMWWKVRHVSPNVRDKCKNIIFWYQHADSTSGMKTNKWIFIRNLQTTTDYCKCAKSKGRPMLSFKCGRSPKLNIWTPLWSLRNLYPALIFLVPPHFLLIYFKIVVF